MHFIVGKACLLGVEILIASSPGIDTVAASLAQFPSCGMITIETVSFKILTELPQFTVPYTYICIECLIFLGQASADGCSFANTANLKLLKH